MDPRYLAFIKGHEQESKERKKVEEGSLQESIRIGSLMSGLVEDDAWQALKAHIEALMESARKGFLENKAKSYEDYLVCWGAYTALKQIASLPQELMDNARKAEKKLTEGGES